MGVLVLLPTTRRVSSLGVLFFIFFTFFSSTLIVFLSRTEFFAYAAGWFQLV